MSEDLFAPWRDEAPCDVEAETNEFMAGAWILEDHPYQDQAAAMCADCPVIRACLQSALLDEEAEGLRAGYWFDSGRVPVAVARDIRDRFPGIVFGEWQSLGRPKK